MRRIAVPDPEVLIFRKREVTSQVLIDDLGQADFIQDDTSTAVVGPDWPSADPAGFLLDDSGDKVA